MTLNTMNLVFWAVLALVAGAVLAAMVLQDLAWFLGAGG
jgi:hypothetical protein